MRTASSDSTRGFPDDLQCCKGVSDHAYVRSILETANEYWQTLPPIDRDFWEFDPNTGESMKVVNGKQVL